VPFLIELNREQFLFDKQANIVKIVQEMMVLMKLHHNHQHQMHL
jgi:hypothetical protein